MKLAGVIGGATLIAPSTQTVTIVMNRPNPPPPPSTNGGTFSFSAPNYATTETSGSVTITVTRVNSTNLAASVVYFTANASAVAGTDYTSTAGTLSWGPDDNTTRTFSVPILNSGAHGPPRLFSVNLNTFNGVGQLGLAKALVSIQLTPAPGVTGVVTIGGKATFNGNVVLQIKP